MTILLLGGHDDPTSVALLETLNQKGHDAELIDSRWFPSDLRLTRTSQGWHIGLPTTRMLRPGEVKTALWCRYNGLLLPDLPDLDQANLAANDSRALLECYLAEDPTPWINGWPTQQALRRRPTLLTRARELGLDVPMSIVSNDASAVRAFARAFPGCTFEPIQGGRPMLLTDDHLSDEAITRLEIAPVMLRAPMPGTEVTAYVMDGRLLACEAQGDRLTPHVLPAEVARATTLLLRETQLTWGAARFRRHEERYGFLDLDASPDLVQVEERGGPPLLSLLLDYLTRERP